MGTTHGNNGRAATVLVVDDNRDLADNVAELLGDTGVDCIASYGAREALSVVSERSCDLAILDIRMPETSGVELLVDIKAACPDAEVILMTANASLDTAIHAVHEGAFAYIEKPFDSQQLLTLAERALTQTRLRQESARLQSDLSRSEALYRKVVDGVDALIIGVDMSGRICMANQPAEAALAGADGTLDGLKMSTLAATEGARDSLVEALVEAHRGNPQKNVELALNTRNGDERVTRWNFSRLEAVGGNEELVLGVGVDLTDRLDLERRAAEAEAMAAIATLTAGLAHEIRNPLNAAALQLQLLKRHTAGLEDPKLQDKVDRRIAIVDSELSRLTNLLDDFLKLAKPQRLSLSPLALPDILHEVMALHEPAARQAGVALSLDCPEETLYAMGDRAMLAQVLMNLVLNAMDALAGTGVGGNVTMRCFALGASRVGVEIADDGPGIPPEVANDLFTPFVTTKNAGTGLGLTIVKRIVERHGGTIQVTAGAKGGTVVRIGLQRTSRPLSVAPPSE